MTKYGAGSNRSTGQEKCNYGCNSKMWSPECPIHRLFEISQQPEPKEEWGKSETRVKAEVLAGLIREEFDLEEAIQTIELNLAQTHLKKHSDWLEKQLDASYLAGQEKGRKDTIEEAKRVLFETRSYVEDSFWNSALDEANKSLDQLIEK